MQHTPTPTATPQTLDDLEPIIVQQQRDARKRHQQLFSSEKAILAELHGLQRRLKTFSEQHRQYPNYEIVVTMSRQPDVLQLELMCGALRLNMLHTGQSFVFFESQPNQPQLDPQYSGVSAGKTGDREIQRISANIDPKAYVQWIEHYFSQSIASHQSAKNHRILLNVSTNLQEPL